MKINPYISFVIPAKDEEKTISILYSKIKKVVEKITSSFEIIFVDDGSTDNSFYIMKSLTKKDKRVKTIKLRGNWGKSVALQVGFDNAKGEIIFTMDADMQDDPIEIPKFLSKIEEGYDLVSGWKKVRHDPFTKTVPSKLGNLTTRILTGIKIHDLNCGFKAYKYEVIKNLYLYGELYKYIPVLAEKQNFKIAEVIISHRPRLYGNSKFGWQRNIKGFLDMLTVVFLTDYLRRPAHFFGTFGIFSFFFGFVIGLYITYLKLTTGTIQYRQPLLFLGILLMIIGIQLVTTGLLGEMIVSFNQNLKERGKYIDKTIG